MICEKCEKKMRLRINMMMVFAHLGLLVMTPETASSKESEAPKTDALADKGVRDPRPYQTHSITTRETPEFYIDIAEQYCLKKEFKVARDAYEKAFEMGAKPWVMFNIAKCSENLEQLKRACAEYKKYISLETETTAYVHLIEISKRKIVELPERLASLQIDDAPPESTLQIDGNIISDFIDKMPLKLDPGHHDLSLTSPGYAPLKVTLDLAAGSQVFITGRLTPLPANGTISVTCAE